MHRQKEIRWRKRNAYPNKQTKGDPGLAIDMFVDRVLETYPNLDREGLREEIRARVPDYVPDDGESVKEEEKKGLTEKTRDKLPGQ